MAMVRIRTFGLVLMAAALACGCASTPSEQPPSLISDAALNGSASSGGSEAAYQLSPQELGYSCKKLTGVMQVRILQVRQYDATKNPSMAARGVQSIATPIFGGTTVGSDPEGQHRRDLAMLEAYNRQLAAKNCKTFDLAAELKTRDPYATPEPSDAKKSP
jgi:hypothetical protein